MGARGQIPRPNTSENVLVAQLAAGAAKNTPWRQANEETQVNDEEAEAAATAAAAADCGQQTTLDGRVAAIFRRRRRSDCHGMAASVSLDGARDESARQWP